MSAVRAAALLVRPRFLHCLANKVSCFDSLTSYQTGCYRNLRSRNLFLTAALMDNKKAITFDTWSSYETEPGVRCNSLCKIANGGKPLERPLTHPNVETVWNLYETGLALNPTGNCLGWREGSTYKWWSYSEVDRRAAKVADGLAAAQLSRQSCVGIYSMPRPEWLVAFLACVSRSLVVVPLYDTLGVESSTYIINQSEMSLLFVDTSAAARRILEKADSTPQLRTIVTFMEPEKEVIELAQAKKISLLSLEKFMTSSGAPNKDLPKAEDLLIILYTSGTTGVPKGVSLTNKNMMASFTGGESLWWIYENRGLKFTKDEVTLLYLPLAHVLGLMNALGFLFHGAAMGFYGGNVLQLIEDAAVLKPTHMAMVPRLMNRIYSKVLGEVAKSQIASAVFWFAYKRKKAMLDRGIVTRTSFWDRLIFNKIQSILGGRIWFMVVGSAPVTPEVLEFWRVVFGCPLITEGYGQTETAGGISATSDAIGSSVGHPLTCSYLKLADVPECNYFVDKGGRGEICVKGPNVMSGYFKAPEKTAEVFDKDGWLLTGDIGEFLADGSLKIVDRKKNLFKLAQGEYVAPDKVENTYLLCPEILQVFVDGSSLENYAVAVVVPDPMFCASYAAERNVDAKALIANKEFRDFIFNTIISVGKKNSLNSYEQVKAIHLVSDPFTIANGLLTPTMKNKRPELRKFFRKEIDALYKAGPFVGRKS